MVPISRRNFIIMGTGGLAQLEQSRRAGKPPKTKPRRLLFNWDGSMIQSWGRTVVPNSLGPLTREQLTSLVFTPIEKTPVDTVLFSFGSGNVAEYQSNVLEWPGEADRFQFPESKTWHGGIEVDPRDQYLNPKSLADSGHNPPAVVVDECHKRGLGAFVSLRMNDIHDGQHPKGTLPNPELPLFKRINPDWLVGDLDWWTALDFEHPKVRSLKLRVIEEFFDRWDFDGIELDWLRHTLYFHRGTERENGKYLTLFMREVRKSLEARAAKRGRRIELAVRIPERVQWCQEGGFEIDKWLSEDLVDSLILGQGLTELPTLNEFRELMKGRPLPIYPTLFCYGNGYRVSPDEVIRGSAANLWKDGADGLCAVNWYLYGAWRNTILNDIADPRLLRHKDKQYTLVQRFEANPRSPGADYVRYNTVSRDAPVPFDLNETDGGHVVQIPIADDVKTGWPVSAELWIAMDYSQPGDRLTVSAGDLALEPVQMDVASNWQTVGYRMNPLPGNGMIGFATDQPFDMQFQAIRLPVPLKALRSGHNQFRFQLNRRGAGSEKPLRVRRIELLTRAFTRIIA